ERLGVVVGPDAAGVGDGAEASGCGGLPQGADVDGAGRLVLDGAGVAHHRRHVDAVGVGLGGDLRAEPGAQGERVVPPRVPLDGQVFEGGPPLHDDLLRLRLPVVGFVQLLVEEGERVVSPGDEREQAAVLVTQFGNLVDCATAAGALQGRYPVGEAHCCSLCARMRAEMRSPWRRRKTVAAAMNTTATLLTALPAGRRCPSWGRCSSGSAAW